MSDDHTPHSESSASLWSLVCGLSPIAKGMWTFALTTIAALGAAGTGATFLARWFHGLDPVAQTAIVLFFILFLLGSVAVTVANQRAFDDMKLARNAAVANARQLETEKHRLEQIDDVIWKRPGAGQEAFVSPTERNTLFVCMMNLKGGVGKTTLTANLAATLALTDDPLNSPLKKLLVIGGSWR